MRSVLFDGADRQHGDAVLRNGFANLGPGEFFVSDFRHMEQSCFEHLIRCAKQTDTLPRSVTSYEDGAALVDHNRRKHGSLHPGTRSDRRTRSSHTSRDLRLLLNCSAIYSRDRLRSGTRGRNTRTFCVASGTAEVQRYSGCRDSDCPCGAADYRTRRVSNHVYCAERNRECRSAPRAAHREFTSVVDQLQQLPKLGPWIAEYASRFKLKEQIA